METKGIKSRRWQKLGGQEAVLGASGRLDELAAVGMVWLDVPRGGVFYRKLRTDTKDPADT
jgi:hypothetical protein